MAGRTLGQDSLGLSAKAVVPQWLWGGWCFASLATCLSPSFTQHGNVAGVRRQQSPLGQVLLSHCPSHASERTLGGRAWLSAVISVLLLM